MPGALAAGGAILLYDFGVLDLVRLAFVVAGHLVLGWIYLLVSLLFLPRHVPSTAGRRNPFAPRWLDWGCWIRRLARTCWHGAVE